MGRNSRPEAELLEQGVLARLSDVDAGYEAAPVLEAIDFEARAGQVAFVTGPTSAGKTTLMHVLRLALLPLKGECIILGTDSAKLSNGARAKLKRRIGYIGENPAFVEDWTGNENIALSLKLAGRRPREFAHDIQELAEFVGLGVAGEEPVKRLSGAARRRVAIARALAAKPDLILADDPTAGLSPEAGRRIVRLLGEMRRVGAGVVIASQDESLVECVPDSVHWRIERQRVVPASARKREEAESFR